MLADLDPVDLWIVHALEKNPPEGNKAIEWFILTTIKINNTSDAEECLRCTANAGRLKNGIVFLSLAVASKNLPIKQLIDCVEQLLSIL